MFFDSVVKSSSHTLFWLYISSLLSMSYQTVSDECISAYGIHLEMSVASGVEATLWSFLVNKVCAIFEKTCEYP